MGPAPRRILNVAAPFFRGSWPGPTQVWDYQSEKCFNVGLFRITPFLVDHSTYDAYALLIESGGKRILYSGDLRAHGRKVVLFERLVQIFIVTKGLAMVHTSAQNIIRIVSIFRATKCTGRKLVINLYTTAILEATGNLNIPQSNWPEIALFVPQAQRIQIKKKRMV